MTNGFIINNILSWFNQNMGELADKIRTMKSSEEYENLQWPLPSQQYNKDDIEQTADIIAKPFGEQESVCCLSLAEHFSGREVSIDYFFYRMHNIGHLIFDILYPDFNKEALEEVAVIEVVCLFFATMSCAYYFQLSKFTPFMAKHIIYTLYDATYVQKGTFATEDKVDMCADMLSYLLHNNTKFLH